MNVMEYKEYFVRATEYAAVACSLLRGCNDKEKADQAAVNAMRFVLASSPIDLRVSIGEGEIDEAPMLYIGEELGTEKGSNRTMPLDIAVDPLECTKNCANDEPNAMTVLAVAPRGKLFLLVTLAQVFISARSRKMFKNFEILGTYSGRLSPSKISSSTERLSSKGSTGFLRSGFLGL